MVQAHADKFGLSITAVSCGTPSAPSCASSTCCEGISSALPGAPPLGDRNCLARSDQLVRSPPRGDSMSASCFSWVASEGGGRDSAGTCWLASSVARPRDSGGGTGGGRGRPGDGPRSIWMEDGAELLERASFSPQRPLCERLRGEAECIAAESGAAVPALAEAGTARPEVGCNARPRGDSRRVKLVRSTKVWISSRLFTLSSRSSLEIVLCTRRE